jgi:hypothetical protein
MGTAEVHDFLKVEEAARILRIGRTAAYQQAHRWLETGTEGLPVRWIGGSLRVPRDQFEQHYSVRITAIPGPEAPPPAPTRAEGPRPGQDIPRSSPSAGRSKKKPTAQGGLPFAG